MRCNPISRTNEMKKYYYELNDNNQPIEKCKDQTPFKKECENII